MTCLKNKTVLTKKMHRCFSCIRSFPAKTKMNYWVGIYEGDFNALYACVTCVEIMNMRQDENADGFEHGFVNEMLEKDQTPEQLLEELKTIKNNEQ